LFFKINILNFNNINSHFYIINHMLPFYQFFYILVRIFIFAKVFHLLYVTSYYPESYPISLLTWWIYFLIFDIWLEVILPNKIEKNNTISPNKSEDKENETPNE